MFLKLHNEEEVNELRPALQKVVELDECLTKDSYDKVIDTGESLTR
jgi:hypothetical protein